MADRSRRELNERIDELEATLEELREEVGPERGPMGLPRPPRPRALLRFTDEYAIPAAIAALEANVRALELVQAGIRATDTERAVDETGRAVRDRASGVGQASLDRLDRALADLESAIEGPGMPRNREASDLLHDARRLNEEIRERIQTGGSTSTATSTAASRTRDEVVRIDVESEGRSDGDATDGGPAGRSAGDEVDVESELETVKEEVESERRGGGEPDDSVPDADE